MASPKTKPGLLWKHWLTQLERLSNKTVLIEAPKNKAWTAQALTKASDQFSEQLRHYSRGERIAFRLANGAEWMAFFLALQRAGLSAVPLDGAMPKEGCLDAARSLGAGALYLDGEFHSLGASRTRNKNCCCVKVTSGTGHLPKAIECRAEHLLADGENVARTMGIRASDTNLAVIPLGHSYGLGNLVMPLIQQGTAMVCATDYVPRQLIEWIGKYRVTVFPGVPALFRVLASLPLGGGKIESLRTVISAGAVLAPVVAQAFFKTYGLKIHNFYGSSETGGICYDRSGSASLTGRSVGKPLTQVSVTVKKGHITIASAAVATRTGKWRAGDLGEWDKRGELVLLGRKHDGANIGGKKVNPLEVERALRSLPGVTDVAVWLQHERGRDFLASAVETMSSRAEIERALALKLPQWKLPKTYLITRELPRSSRGKLDLKLLRTSVSTV
jgi:acyl-coenzyme A synthetase/AMP-(fatty) acid ligase